MSGCNSMSVDLVGLERTSYPGKPSAVYTVSVPDGQPSCKFWRVTCLNICSSKRQLGQRPLHSHPPVRSPRKRPPQLIAFLFVLARGTIFGGASGKPHGGRW